MAFVVETAINGSKRCWVESSMAVAVARKAVSNSFAMDKISATARVGDLGRADLLWPSFESRPKRTREKAKAAYIAANNEIDHALPKAEVIVEGRRTGCHKLWIHVERLH